MSRNNEDVNVYIWSDAIREGSVLILAKHLREMIKGSARWHAAQAQREVILWTTSHNESGAT